MAVVRAPCAAAQARASARRRSSARGCPAGAAPPQRAPRRLAAAADDAPGAPVAAAGAEPPAQAGSRPPGGAPRSNSTWGDVADWSKPGEDVLYNLGQQSPSMRIDMGARRGVIDDLFVGKFMGQQADIANGSLRMYERRTLAHLCGDYAIPPRFLDAVSLHLVKNFLAESGQLSAGVPLILGIWGAKGGGKSFNVELVCKKLGVQPIIMSSGELEDEYAGEPGRRIRERYRMASQTVRNSGIMSCLIINDLDAGCGRFRNTQQTVNNQIVMGTLMNLADHPTRASVGESWREDKTLRRVPIIITGNDLSTLYAPLLRDGRMNKFLWQPDRDDLLEMLHALYQDDGLSRDDVARLLDAFSHQTLDFFGALRARQHDSLIRAWAAALGEAELGNRLRAVLRRRDDADLPEGSPPDPPVEGLPDFAAAGAATIGQLLAAGRDLEREQEEVNSHKLSEAYMKTMTGGASLIGFG